MVPGNLFVGYKDVIAKMIVGFINEKSYAIIGGRKCGKTSFFLQLQKELKSSKQFDRAIIPAYFAIQEMSEVTPASLFCKIYETFMKSAFGEEFEPWQPCEKGYEYDGFRKQLLKTIRLLENKIGPNFIIVLLFDEMDGVLPRLENDLFFQNIRHFFMQFEYSSHFRLCASGVQNMYHLIKSGSSPLNNLFPEYLHALPEKDASELIEIGFAKSLSEEIKNSIFTLTGRHPFIMQGILEKLYPMQNSLIGMAEIQQAQVDFCLSMHGELQKWYDTFEKIKYTFEIYDCLWNSSDKSLTRQNLLKNFPSVKWNEIETSLRVLWYHGLIETNDFLTIRLSGTLIRDWIRDQRDNILISPSLPTPLPPLPPPPPQHVVQEKIIIKTFGTFSIYKGGQELLFDKDVNKRRLLKAIIALGGANVPLLDLELCLWPDRNRNGKTISCDSKKSEGLNVSQYIYRSNKCIVSDLLIQKEKRVSINETLCEVDAMIFLRKISEGMKNTNIDTIEKMIIECDSLESDVFINCLLNNLQGVFINSLEDAIKLYRGTFLPNDFEGKDWWIKEYREKLAIKYYKCVLCTVSLLIAQKKIPQAGEILHSVRQFIQCNEVLSLLLMKVCCAMNNKTKAKEYFCITQKELLRIFGRKPESFLSDFFNKL